MVNVHAKALSGAVAGPVALVIRDITVPLSRMWRRAWSRRRQQGVPEAIVEHDNRGGAFQATSHLLAAGHRHILFLGGDPLLNTAEHRHSGHLDALRAGLEFTTVFAGTDMVALGALAALREAGIDVPGEVSVVGSVSRCVRDTDQLFRGRLQGPAADLARSRDFVRAGAQAVGGPGNRDLDHLSPIRK